MQAEFGSDIQLHHVASCDICPKARKFIAEHHEPDYIFGDMRQLSSPLAYDYVSEKVVTVPTNARATTPAMICTGGMLFLTSDGSWWVFWWLWRWFVFAFCAVQLLHRFAHRSAAAQCSLHERFKMTLTLLGDPTHEFVLLVVVGVP